MATYLDSGRQVDLLRIDQRINDKNSPPMMVRGYQRTKAKVLKQLKDKKLAQLRERMMSASRHNDQWEMWKISCLIQDHTGQERAEYWN